MRNFYHSCKFCTLTINFSDVWPSVGNCLCSTFQKRVEIFSNTYLQEPFSLMIHLENALKTSLQDVLKMSWRRFCKASWRRFEDIFAKRLENFLKTSWRRMTRTNILVLTKTYLRRLKMSSEEVWLRRIYSSWLKRLEDVFCRRRRTPSSRRLQDVFIKTNICLVLTWSARCFVTDNPIANRETTFTMTDTTL